MTDDRSSEHRGARKTPAESSEFEREQLRFLLTGEDVSETLAQLNPSLAWLPVLQEMRVTRGGTELVGWIEKNFADPQAVRDVAANLRFFHAETATLLEYRLNQTAPTLPSVLNQCWKLIVRYLKDRSDDHLRNEWFEIEPQIKTGDHSFSLLARLAGLLRPKLRLGKRSSLFEKNDENPQRPSDLMSIDYEVEEGLSAEEVLKSWPIEAASETDAQLLELLTNELVRALAEASDIDIESDRFFSISDSDVPSVAAHAQNAHRSGFLVIVRVIAELWLILARKDAEKALPLMEKWRSSSFRLMHRLALFASTQKSIDAKTAAYALIELPRNELFITNTTVEVYRLIRARWTEFSKASRNKILARLCEGPERNLFREGTEIDQAIDRARFDLLAEMARDGLELSPRSARLLASIRQRYPGWVLRPPEQAGFHIWHSGVRSIEGDQSKLDTVHDDELVSTAKRLKEAASFMDGDHWQAFCQSNPDRATNGLAASAKLNDWSGDYWRPLLWSRKVYESPHTESLIGRLLLLWPIDKFGDVADSASSWLQEHNATLDDSILWPLWDKIAATTLVGDPEAELTSDVLTQAINSAPGHLAEILVHKLASSNLDEIILKLDFLIGLPGRAGKLARVFLASQIAYLFERAFSWTKCKLVPLFDWSSIDANDVWEARVYSGSIGSPELFRLLKNSFLQIFSRKDFSTEGLRRYAEWMVIILLANKERLREQSYDLEAFEARAALRRGGAEALSSAAHCFAVEMESVPEHDRGGKWSTTVGPVFKATWPIDIELQTHRSTFKLVQLLRATGDSFPDAADTIIPLIRPDDARSQTTVFYISGSPDEMFKRWPERMLDLVAAVVGDAPPNRFYGIDVALEKVRTADPALALTRKFQRLASDSPVR